MLVLKLRRVGKKHQPSYRLVAAERRSKSTGKYLEGLGWYDPRTKEQKINKERVLYWLKNGAQKTDTVHNLLINSQIIFGKKIPVHSKKNIPDKAATAVGIGNDKVDQVNKNQQEAKNMDEQTNPNMPTEESGSGEMMEEASETPATSSEEVEVSVPEVAPETPAAPSEDGGADGDMAVPETSTEEAPVDNNEGEEAQQQW